MPLKTNYFKIANVEAFVYESFAYVTPAKFAHDTLALAHAFDT